MLLKLNDGREFRVWWGYWDKNPLLPRVIVVYLAPPDVPPAQVPVSGYAKCSPRDQFTRAKGRKIAFTRAIQGFSKSERAQLWQELWSKGVTQ